MLGKYTPWPDINPFKPKYKSHLTRILSHTNTILQPQLIIEEIKVRAAAPWDATNRINVHIHPGNQNITAQQHHDKHFFTHANPTFQCSYTDGSLIEGIAGPGIDALVADNTIHESSYYLGTEQEVFGAELYGIMKATEIATKLSLDKGYTKDPWKSSVSITTTANEKTTPNVLPSFFLIG